MTYQWSTPQTGASWFLFSATAHYNNLPNRSSKCAPSKAGFGSWSPGVEVLASEYGLGVLISLGPPTVYPAEQEYRQLAKFFGQIKRDVFSVRQGSLSKAGV